MTKPKSPASFPEDESMDPVGEPYTEQESEEDPDLGEDPPHPENAPFDEPDIPQDPEFERTVQPD